jgi:hypothetical protein
MWLMYYISVTTVGKTADDWVNNTLFGDWLPNAATAGLKSIGSPDWLQGLVVNGIIGGVGTVLGFVPQMLLIFFFLSVLEDSGYMARVAFIMDRIFRRFGLSGKSFIPMLIGSGCGVPAIMAARTIENEKGPPHDHHAFHLHPMYGEDRHHRHDCVDVLPRFRFHCARHVFPRHRYHCTVGHCLEKDEVLRRRPGPIRHGASRLPYPVAERRSHPHVGAFPCFHH